MTRNLSNSVRQLERRFAPKREHRIVVRFEGPGSERFPRPTPEGIKEFPVITVCFVEAKDGRSVDKPELVG